MWDGISAFQFMSLIYYFRNLTIGPVKAKGIEESCQGVALKYLEKVKILSEANKYPDQLSGTKATGRHCENTVYVSRDYSF